MKELNVKIGSFYKSKNGNIYLKVTMNRSIYICNEEFIRSDNKEWDEAVFADVETINYSDIKKILK